MLTGNPLSMRSAALAITASAAAVHAASLSSVCTSSYVQSVLPPDEFISGITIDASSVTASAVYNTSVASTDNYPAASGLQFCNVTFAYTHDGRNDQVLVNYWLPAPSNFQNRYLSTGGGGLAINSGISTTGSLPGGIMYGAVSGLTDGGFGGFTNQVDAVYLLANGTINWEIAYLFGYQAHNELAKLGKEFTKLFYGMNSTKLYSYYQACSEGGREGWSQVQRFGDQFDGAIIGAPAFRYSFQQAQHLYSNFVEQTLDYYPPPCELAEIVNLTITACDSLDGKVDGVVARTDLCKLHFDLNSTIGQPYYCAATSGGSGGFKAKRQYGGGSSTPAQNGTISAQGVNVAKTIIDGLHDTEGKRAYLSYQPTAAFTDAETAYNTTTDKWELSISTLGGEWITRFLHLQNSSTLDSIAGLTYDNLRDWMYEGWQLYEDSLQTDWPDLTPIYKAGGKILHYHGESDYSIPTASSVHYHESVRKTMYPNLSYNASQAALGDWYKLYLIPGGSHCAPNTAEPNGPWPQTNMAVMIDWVENGNAPTTLNGTVLQGAQENANQQICAWPLRPYWSNPNATDPDCVYDQASIDTWTYNFDSFKMPVY